MEQIKEMLEKIEKGGDFAEEMRALIKEGYTDGIIRFAGENGFAFTEADWKAYLDWSGSLTTLKTVGEPLAPEELEVVSGGGDWSWNPSISGCWFHAASNAEFKDNAWRRRCNQYVCKAFIPGMGGDNSPGWYQCGCWGKDKCVGSWHYEAGCPK